jgi:O-antigen/teichoic acid export membrane protein
LSTVPAERRRWVMQRLRAVAGQVGRGGGRMARGRVSREHVAGTAWALFGLVGPTLMQLLYVVVAARALSVDHFGQLMLCVAVGAIAMTLSGAGSGGVAMKAIARDGNAAPRYFGQTIGLTLLTAPVVLPASVAVMLLVSHVPMPLTLALCVALADVVFWRIAVTCQQIFIGMGQQARSALVGITIPLARFAAAAFILLDPPQVPLVAFAIAYAASTFVAMLVAVAYTSRRVGRPVLSWSRFRYDEGVSFALLWLNNTLQVECDKLILSYFASLADVGVYALASRLMDGAYSPPRALKNMLQARMFREGAAGHNAIFRFSLRIVPIIVVYGVLVWIAIVVCAPLAVYMFGEHYARLASILPMIGALPLLRTLTDIGGEVFIASDHVTLSTAVQVFGTVVRIVLGIIFVRAAGLSGAVAAALVATLIAGVVFWGSSWLFSRRRVGVAG